MDQGGDSYANDWLGIRVVADRSQWYVEVHPETDGIDAGGWKGWFSLEAWSACLGQPTLFHDPRPKLTDQDWVAVIENSWRLEPQLGYLREHLDDFGRRVFAGARRDHARLPAEGAPRAVGLPPRD